MLPATSFSELGKHLMFVVVDKTIYHTENSKPTASDYLYLCGLQFPLVKSETLRNMENRYLKRNSKHLQELKDRYATSVTSDANFIEKLESGLQKNKNLHFFISEVIPAFAGGKIENIKLEKIRKEESIFEKLLEDAAIINRRVYPLFRMCIPSMVNVNNLNYSFNSSEKTVERIEYEFQLNLEEKLKREVLEKIEQSDEMKNKISGLEKEIRDIAVKKHLTIANNCFEYGNIGYDSKNQRIYCFLPPHYNRTTHKNYGEKQGAIAVTITEGGLLANPIIISRKNENSDFIVDCTSLCLGMGGAGTTNRQIIGFLLKASENINWNRACHE